MLSPDRLPWKSREPSMTPRRGETCIEAFSTHWIKYVSPGIIFILFMLGGILLLMLSGTHVSTASVPEKGAFLAGLLIMVFINHWFFRRLLSEGMEEVIITNERFIFLETNLWSSDTSHEVSLDQVIAVEARKEGFIQNLLRYGSLWFDTGGSDMASCTIPFIPHPHGKAKAVAPYIGRR